MLAYIIEFVLSCFTGVLLGNIVGVLPGIGAPVVLALLLPIILLFTDPSLIIVFMAGVYYGSAYGETLSSVMTGVPGEFSTAIVNDDAYYLRTVGRAEEVLFISTLSSFISGIISVGCLWAFVKYFASFVKNFGAVQESFILLIALLVPIIVMKNKLKTASMVCLGMLIGLIGVDMTSGVVRFQLFMVNNNPIHSIVFISGFVGLSLAFYGLFKPADHKPQYRLKDVRVPLGTICEQKWPLLRGTFLGFFAGLVPGFTAVSSSTVAYFVEKKINTQNKMGAIAAVEASNNSHNQSTFLPLLLLGIPVSAITSLILFVLVSKGIRPNHMFFEKDSNAFYLITGSMILGNIILLLFNLKLINLWISLLKLPRHLLLSLVLICCLVGAYNINHSFFDVILVILFGLFGAYLRRYEYDVTLLLVGFLIGPLFEDTLKRAILLTLP